MQNYVISEEEIRIIRNRLEVEEFLAGKQPVELMAEGEVIIDSEDGEVWIGEGETWMHGELVKFEGQIIKIYIQNRKE